MSYSKARYGYSLKAVMKAKMKTSPQEFQWSLRVRCLDSSWATLSYTLLLLTRIMEVLVECIVEPLPPGSAAAQFRQW